MDLPKFVRATQGRVFSFYQEGALYQGLTLETGFYQLVEFFRAENRHHGYTLGCDLVQQGIDTVITVDDDSAYRVWVSVGSKVAIAPSAHQNLNDIKVSYPDEPGTEAPRHAHLRIA